jgi:hypothetical protein
MITILALAKMVPVLAKTVPALAKTVPALAKTVPALAKTVRKMITNYLIILNLKRKYIMSFSGTSDRW